MKKLSKLIYLLVFFASFMLLGLFFILFPGKNSKEYIACFDTKPLAYRSFRHIMHFPQIGAATTFFIKYPNGKWKLPAKCSYIQMLHCLKYHKRFDEKCKITFIDGMIASQIEELLNNNKDLSGKKVQIKEGTIFPDTYYFNSGNSRAMIVKIAQDLMKKHVETVWEKLEKSANNACVKLPITKEEFVILASIVQKEGITKEDMIIISSCFLSRLQKRIRLHSCATVFYGLKKANLPIYKKNNLPILLLKDTKIKTPYNTYLLDRLPIEPICMPGINAIEALAMALHNAINNAIVTKKGKLLQYNAPLYFYSCNDGVYKGKIMYANTLQEHNRNREICKKLLKTRSINSTKSYSR